MEAKNITEIYEILKRVYAPGSFIPFDEECPDDRKVEMRIISGGQTGVDRAALDAAIEIGLPTGGYCPRGRKAEDGPIDPKYQLTETTNVDYVQRTTWNVQMGHATLMLNWGPTLTSGTKRTLDICQAQNKPWWIIDLQRREMIDTQALLKDMLRKKVQILNVAGPRESKFPGIQALAKSWLLELFRPIKELPEWLAPEPETLPVAGPQNIGGITDDGTLPVSIHGTTSAKILIPDAAFVDRVQKEKLALDAQIRNAALMQQAQLAQRAQIAQQQAVYQQQQQLLAYMRSQFSTAPFIDPKTDDEKLSWFPEKSSLFFVQQPKHVARISILDPELSGEEKAEEEK